MSNPSKPLNISSPRHAPDDLLTASGSPGQQSFGTPTGRLVRSGTPSTPPIANIPPRAGASSPTFAGPASFGARSFRTHTPQTGGSSTPTAVTSESPTGAHPHPEDVTDEEMVRVLRRHLVSRRAPDVDDAGPTLSADAVGSRRVSDSETSSARNGNGVVPQREDSEPFPIPYDAPGGDITHPIYKWQADQRRQAVRPRAAPLHPAFEHIREPGGFRRNYVILRANEQGIDEPAVAEEAIAGTARPAGPSLEAPLDLSKPLTSETAPLLPREASKRSVSRRRRLRRASVGPHDAVLMFVGTGVLFLGKAFFNGGILFSTVTLVGIALISLYSFLLLVKTKVVVPGSFGDIGGKLYGPWMRYAILGSIAVSQLGFVSAYTIFVSQNLQAFVLAISNCLKFIPIQYFIIMQLIILLPLVLIRNIAKLSIFALVADVFILAGLLYIFGSEIAVIANRGIAKVELFNPKDFPLLIGTAVFSFEGVIPISDSMREPRKFPAVLTGVMLFLTALALTVLFGGAGVLAYLAFGPEIQTVVITNLNSESKFVQAVQFLYSLAILLSVPLQLFPAVRIMENGIFTRSGKENPRVKWQKNIFRFLIVAWAGASDLDKFVALVGSFACVPLCYVYPALLHYKACARTRRAKIADMALLAFGSAAAVYTTVQTLALMVAPSEGSPKFGKCDAPSPLV
ncbi:transmembrane amino acid transporter protein-domain-containing protein [Phellopilus nigrolimitatus]|nr:transmembrane amino acid transporter protein-domain-containing protein [Phellopilus nigrolimitatus]